ncbi:hypothetical protein E4T44_00127 [Aureobasidium sp. EXF-8845]|nr:hypothetical protein E4T44_00127 [Aureobasidium sp. EXF-8845]KAI4858344.1 hypothetical protein E4T45_00138 [Aureobasidium sp. EXF-8846]
MPLEIRQVEKGDILSIAQLDQIAMRDYGVHHTIEKVQKEEGVDITYSFERWISTGMEHHAQTFWKVVDSETDELVSVAKFTFQYHEGEAYQDTPVEGEKPPPKRLLDFFTWLNKRSEEIAKEHYAGSPHAYLTYLATHPAYRRRGAAHMLLEKGMQKADEAGLDMYLQASLMGAPLYKKFGFEVMSMQEIDLSQWGVDQVETRTYMSRMTRGVRQ